MHVIRSLWKQSRSVNGSLFHYSFFLVLMKSLIAKLLGRYDIAWNGCFIRWLHSERGVFSPHYKASYSSTLHKCISREKEWKKNCMIILIFIKRNNLHNHALRVNAGEFHSNTKRIYFKCFRFSFSLISDDYYAAIFYYMIQFFYNSEWTLRIECYIIFWINLSADNSRAI